MNVYDFDKTIFKYDSTEKFYIFCLKRHKKILLRTPNLIKSYLKFYKLHKGTKLEFKTNMYQFLKDINIRKDVNDFWEQNKKYIKPWYLKQKKNTDIIISASPEFLLKPICDELGVSLIASKVSPITGKTNGKNCYNIEKVNRLKDEYNEFHIENFYSDSYSDTPLALLADNAFIVDDNKLIPWDFNAKYEVII